jgi:hypothetical protein
MSQAGQPAVWTWVARAAVSSKSHQNLPNDARYVCAVDAHQPLYPTHEVSQPPGNLEACPCQRIENSALEAHQSLCNQFLERVALHGSMGGIIRVQEVAAADRHPRASLCRIKEMNIALVSARDEQFRSLLGHRR